MMWTIWTFSVLFLQQTVKKFLALSQRFRLPLFLADTTALTLLSHDALRQHDRMVREPHCSFLCTGRPVMSFALNANLWKYDVSAVLSILFLNIWRYIKFLFQILPVDLPVSRRAERFWSAGDTRTGPTIGQSGHLVRRGHPSAPSLSSP